MKKPAKLLEWAYGLEVEVRACEHALGPRLPLALQRNTLAPSQQLGNTMQLGSQCDEIEWGPAPDWLLGLLSIEWPLVCSSGRALSA